MYTTERKLATYMKLFLHRQIAMQNFGDFKVLEIMEHTLWKKPIIIPGQKADQIYPLAGKKYLLFSAAV